jgi:hypothetical protein
VKANL